MKKMFSHKYLSIALIVCGGFHFQSGFSQAKTILQGQIKQSDGAPLRNSAVMLIQYNPAAKTTSVIDSSFTDADGKYKFDGNQQYFILAVPDPSASNELPSYYGNSIFSKNASSVSFNYAETITADFATSKKTSVSGSSSLGGFLFSGSSLKEKIPVFLFDKNNNPLDFTTTNSLGYFQFVNLPNGDYLIKADVPGNDNSSSDEINLNSLNPKKDSLNFKIEENGVMWIDNAFTSIEAALAYKHKVYSLQLNSLQHDVAAKSLVIGADGSRMLLPQVGEFKNLESLSIDINQILFLPADIGKLGKLMSLSAALNKLTSLPNEIAGLKNLRSLNIGKNDFKTFPDAITSITSLESINMESNPMPAIPATINNLKNLKELNLSGCFDLLALPVQIGELSNLESLDLSNCIKLKALPKELNNLKNLKVLDISGTKLSAKSFQKAVPGCVVKVTKK